MTLYEYKLLDEAEQYEAIWDYGEMIGDRLEGEYRILLYQLFGFYVELYYHIELNVLKKAKDLSKYRSFRTLY